jgi:copper resistance protein B
MESMPGMDHSQMNHGAKSEVGQGGESGPAPHAGHDMGNMKKGGNAMDHGSMSMQGGSAPPDARDPHAYSGGYDFSQLPMRHEDHQINFGLLRADRFEAVRVEDDSFATYDLQAGYGCAFDRVMIKAEGDVDSGDLAEATTDLLWSHAVATFWNTQLGLRYDSGAGSDRGWLAVGVQGLAP